MTSFEMICADSLEFMGRWDRPRQIDLVISSPPYNIGKAYENVAELDVYVRWQSQVIKALVHNMRDGASFVWQVGNYVNKGEIVPLEYVQIRSLLEAGLKLRNRYIWHFGHGLHARHRFSGRHESVLWLTKGDGFYFDPKIMLPAGAPLPADTSDIAPHVLDGMVSGLWDIPNVKHNHVEKVLGGHPCQFPVGLAERVVLGLSRPGELVVDPFAGVGSAGVAAIAHGRDFIGIDRDQRYCALATERLEGVASGETRWRPHDLPVERPKPLEETGLEF